MRSSRILILCILACLCVIGTLYGLSRDGIKSVTVSSNSSSPRLVESQEVSTPSGLNSLPSPGGPSPTFTRNVLKQAGLEEHMSVSADELRRQIRKENNKKRREALVAEVENESVKESIAGLLVGGPSELFGVLETDWQSKLLNDPRVARLLALAIHGDDTTRQQLLVAAQDAIQKLLEGGGSPPLTFSAGALANLLAEVDVTGESMPLLLDWYTVELERGQSEFIAHPGTIPTPVDLGPEQTPVVGQTSDSELIAGAIYRILGTLGAPPKIETPLTEPIFGRAFQPRNIFLELQNYHLAELTGLLMLPELSPQQCEQIVQSGRDFLATSTTNGG